MKQFLASVGTAKLFAKKNGKLIHIADTKTLTEGTLNFNTQFEDIKGGTGGILLGRFNHDNNLEISLTDMKWDINYLSMILGSFPSDSIGLNTGFFSETINNAGPTVLLSRMPADMGAACGLNKKIIWIKELGCNANNDNIVTIEITNNSKIIITPRNLIGKKICLRYFVNMPETKAIKVPANFIPSELVLLLTTKLFSGDPNNPESGKPIGDITIKIPRFSLDGEVEFALSPSQAVGTQIKGKALVDIGSCSSKGVYVEIIEVNYSSTAATGLVSLEVDPDSVVPHGLPIVYGYYKDGHIAEIPFEDCVFVPSIDKTIGLVAGESYTVYVGDISTVFKVDSHFVGNPIIINSNVETGKTASLVIYDNNAPYDEEIIEEIENVAFTAGDWSLEVIGDPNSDEFVNYETADLIAMRAGNILVSVIAD